VTGRLGLSMSVVHHQGVHTPVSMPNFGIASHLCLGSTNKIGNAHMESMNGTMKYMTSLILHL
jgi:hypothetical protein